MIPPEYQPDLVASALELAVGAGVLTLLVQHLRYRRLRPQRTAALIAAEDALRRLADLLQSTYVEALPERPPHVPQRVAQLVPRWRDALPRLDLRASPSVRPMTQDWARHIALEVRAIRRGLRKPLEHYAEAIGEDYANRVAELEADPYLDFLARLPEFTDVIQPKDTPVGITPLYGFFESGEVPQMLDDFCDRVNRLFDTFFRIAGHAVVPDEIRWIDAVAPFWGRSSLPGGTP